MKEQDPDDVAAIVSFRAMKGKPMEQTDTDDFRTYDNRRLTEHIAEQFERLLGHFECTALYELPIQPHFTQFAHFPTMDPTRSLSLQVTATSDGQALELFLQGPDGACLKRGLWHVADLSWADGQKMAERVNRSQR